MNGGRTIRSVIGFGSNLGDKTATIEAALAALTQDGTVRELRRSRLYRTAPWGFTEQDWFVNGCVLVETGLTPRALLDHCLAIEQVLGRVRDRRWGPRLIDLDILLYGDHSVNEPGLVIPHPEITRRAFVLVPLAEIVPDAIIAGKKIVDHRADMGASGIVAL